MGREIADCQSIISFVPFLLKLPRLAVGGKLNEELVFVTSLKPDRNSLRWNGLAVVDWRADDGPYR